MDWTYTLYTRAGCQLCQEAEELMRQHWPEALEVVDLAHIADPDEKAQLIARYGHELPLLLRRSADGREQWCLRWHFQRQVVVWLWLRKKHLGV